MLAGRVLGEDAVGGRDGDEGGGGGFVDLAGGAGFVGFGVLDFVAGWVGGENENEKGGLGKGWEGGGNRHTVFCCLFR